MIRATRTPSLDSFRHHPVLGCLTILVMFGMSVAPIFFAWPLLGEWWQSRNWEPTAAVITSARVTEVESDRRGGGYRPQVRYRYEFGGGSFVGSRIDFADVMGPEEWAKRRLEGLEPGSEVRCYVDPRDPERVVLRRDAGIALVVSGMFHGVGVFAATTVIALALSRTRRGTDGAPLRIIPVRERWAKVAWHAGWAVVALGGLSIGLWVLTALLTRTMSLLLIPPVVVLLAVAGFFLLEVFLLARAVVNAFNPWVEFTLDPGLLRPLRPTWIGYRLHDAGRRIAWVRLTLECRRHRVEGSGKHRTVVTDVLSARTLLEVEGTVPPEGRARFVLSREDVQRFTPAGSSRSWWLCIRAGISGRPDINDEVRIAVGGAA